MTHLVVGYPGPLSVAVVQRLVGRGETVCVVGGPGPALADGVEFIPGDCAKIDFGLSGAVYVRLCQLVTRVTVVETTEQLPPSEQGYRDLESSRPVRVAAEVAEFARAAAQLNGVVFLSSLAVFGDASGVVFEKDLDVGQSFSHQRDEVLAVAEKQIRALPVGLPCVIVRTANLVGYESSGEILIGSELGRLAKFAVAAPDDCQFTFLDQPLHFETVERTAAVLVRVVPTYPAVTLHLIDDEPWTDRQLLTWFFERLHKRITDVPRGTSAVSQLFRAATTQSGRVRTSKADFERNEAVRQVGDLLSREVGLTLENLFGRGPVKELTS